MNNLESLLLFLCGKLSLWNKTCRYVPSEKICSNLVIRKLAYMELINLFLERIDQLMPVTVAARSEAWTVFARSNVGIMGSNPTWGMDVNVRLFCVCAVLCVQVAALRRADPPSEESYRLCIGSRMYVCKGWAITPAPSPRSSTMYCATPTANPLLILHSGWNVGP
jgi:hypothetical protein